MEWTKTLNQIGATARVPIKSWCDPLEDEALKQAKNLACHPVVESHVALMPDAHVGYGMPIGGVIGCKGAVIPNAVGVDIGCGMGAIETNIPTSRLKDMKHIRQMLELVKKNVPVGEGRSHQSLQEWDGFDEFRDSLEGDEPGWLDSRGWELDQANLGTLGGGNHFIELQESEEGDLWLMLHSGSRNLGYRVASHYHRTAQRLNDQMNVELPDHQLAFLPTDTEEGAGYIRDMNFALAYARENRCRMMEHFKHAAVACLGDVQFVQEINIHHNYAALEQHEPGDVWVHRKGATSARKNELGIIPGSMGTPSYIVRGLGNPDSFESCSHGAGRRMGRKEACRRLTLEQCNKAMEGIVFDRWKRAGGRFGKKKRKKGAPQFDFGEAPMAYKNIEHVIKAELDLVQPVVRLRPLGVIKG